MLCIDWVYSIKTCACIGIYLRSSSSPPQGMVAAGHQVDDRPLAADRFILAIIAAETRAPRCPGSPSLWGS